MITVGYEAKQKRETVRWGSLRSDRPTRPAGLRGEIKGEASAARRMPEDIRPEGLPAAPGPSDCAEACNRTIQPQSGEEPNEHAPRCGPFCLFALSGRAKLRACQPARHRARSGRC